MADFESKIVYYQIEFKPQDWKLLMAIVKEGKISKFTIYRSQLTPNGKWKFFANIPLLEYLFNHREFQWPLELIQSGEKKKTDWLGSIAQEHFVIWKVSQHLWKFNQETWSLESNYLDRLLDLHLHQKISSSFLNHKQKQITRQINRKDLLEIAAVCRINNRNQMTVHEICHEIIKKGQRRLNSMEPEIVEAIFQRL